jgi:hypothetical protein
VVNKDEKSKPGAFSDSDRAELDELLSERRFQDLLKARRKRIIDAIKGWAGWITAVAAAVTLISSNASAAWKQLMKLFEP